MCMSVLLDCMLVHAMSTKEEKRASDPLEPELQVFVNCYVGVGKQTWVPCKNHKYS